MGDPSFWDDPVKAKKIQVELSALKDTVERHTRLTQKLHDAKTLFELLSEEEDETLVKELEEEISLIQKEVQSLELEVLLKNPYDKNNAYLELHAGAGGTEAQDWTQMLLRMYTRWAVAHGFHVSTVDILPGDEAGIKSVMLEIEGYNAYGYLKSEQGVHRLVRISPFDANKRRHTSFCACDVMPELDDAVEVNLNMDDVRVDTYRSSGAGGQHINKTSSAVRMTHLPTGIVVQCQNERSQIQNREQCLKMLRAKLFELEEAKKEEERLSLMGVQKKIEWGSQIRSYVFQPYTLVKDHRTNAQTSNVEAVMDGDIDIFIERYLAMKANGEL